MWEVTKAEMNLLEKIFAKEIVGSFYQTKSKLAKSLEERGYIQEIERTFGRDRFAVTCRGYILTFMGNATYCLSLKDETL